MDNNETVNEVIKKISDKSQPGCSSGISSSSDNCKCGSTGVTNLGKGMKMTIFIIVLLSVFAVAAHSLLKESGKENGKVSLQQETSSPAFTIAKLASKADVSAEAGAIIESDSINSLFKMASEKKAEVVFIFLAGDNEKSTRTASSKIKAAMNKLLSNGKQVAAFTLKKNAEGYEQLIKDFSVQSLPVVIVAGKGCAPSVISDEITETKLLNAFVKGSVPSSCDPKRKASAKSGCS